MALVASFHFHFRSWTSLLLRTHRLFPVAFFAPSRGFAQQRHTDAELAEFREVRAWLSKFTIGMIPLASLDIRYARSSGPGGQNVNKVSTKVDMRWKVAEASWLPAYVRTKLIANKRVNSEGELIVTSQVFRTQPQNQSDCLQKIFSIIVEASWTPKEAAASTVERIAVAHSKSNEKRLREKKMLSARKKKNWDRDEEN